ncbi:MAG: adenine phosphoribosyltransferase [Kordiimonadaceae bacterium]|jgi:adenine phosphoribosyltransferase|nr:adenine phosphoribosyltransferase [Kordiimonadaceae bacterium]MBT6036794.1 adenine phosphoribosyltransferase [Kordiimonadaceae bacterium]MBT6330172.1 adenine phosphoribosyltransferase [Kordiimonadaceae bacterium]MBT7582401.1 adenine phosphoribosyltransferase [Kordiimonadaceae bacterium]
MSWVKDYVRTIPDYPKAGILFRDVTTIFESDVAYPKMINEFVDYYKDKGIDKVAGIEARGFILGGAIAHMLGIGFITIRKAGKLPHLTHKEDYELEYGTDALEIHIDAIEEGENILIVDDLIATGGTAVAALKLINKAGGKVSEACFIIDLPELGGTDKLKSKNCNVYTLAEYEGL